MVSIDSLLKKIDELTIAKKVGLPNDEARISYPLKSNTVDNFDDFARIIGDYYNHHFSHCVASGVRLSASEARGRAKEILKREYRGGGGDITAAYSHAHGGTNGGLRVVLDTIAESIKAKSVERYIRDVFDRHVTPNSWERKVEIIRQFINQTGMERDPSINKNKPEMYAQNYQELIRAHVKGLQITSSIFKKFYYPVL